jgi:phospholipid-binding lipoprotein MlaA
VGLASIFVTLLTGCAATHERSTTASSMLVDSAITATPASRETARAPVSDNDRLERFNRAVYRFNRALDRKLVRPVARGYDKVVPHKVQRRVRHFFTNLQAPMDIVNNLLQGKFVDGFADFGRFLFNSTAGLGGLFDPATRVGLERHPEDFGQTLAVWGVPSGSYLVLPVLGAGTVRDWGMYPLDVRTDLLFSAFDSDVRTKLLVWRFIATRAALLPAERALDASFDEYVFVREAYLQNRSYQIRDGAPEYDEYLFAEPTSTDD